MEIPDLVTRLAQTCARNFLTVCPPPDAKWFVEVAIRPLLEDFIAAAIREALEEAEKVAREHTGTNHKQSEGCADIIAAALAALRVAGQEAPMKH